MLNEIVLMGRLVADPSFKTTPSGASVANFKLAVDRDFAEKGGQKQADFIEIVAWRNTAEFVSKYFFKGQMAVVSGRLQLRDWTDKDGNKRKTAEVVADNVYFAESKKSREDSTYTPRTKSTDKLDAFEDRFGSGGFEEISDDDGSLPF